MQCPACGHQNRESAGFCGSCAAPLSGLVACPSCGNSNPFDHRFCDSCGQALARDEAPARAATSAGLPHSLAGGRYQLKRFVGEGGRKRVYLARDSRVWTVMWRSR